MITTRENFTQHVALLRPALMAWAVSLSRSVDTAEELVQETMLSALRKPDRYDFERSLQTWLNTVLINLWRDRLRRKKFRDKHEAFSFVDDLYVSEEAPIDIRIGARRELEHVWSLIEQLPERLRTVLTMIAFEERSRIEVAEKLKTTPMTIKGELKKAREMLRQLLETHSFSIR